MDFANKVVNAAVKAANNNTVLNVCLVGVFVALSVRSVSRQRDIEALEAHKDSLTQSNKVMKKAMWEWKQQLLAEASSNDSPPVPLSRLKAIYGEAPVSPQIDVMINTQKEQGKLTGRRSIRINESKTLDP